MKRELIVAFRMTLVTLVQLLYLESLRLRPRERPALEYFKETLQPRIGVDPDAGEDHRGLHGGER